MRPIGSIIFGHIGDRYGRKPALMASVSAMAFSTFAIGLLPTYAQVGSLAPLILILLRMVQGASVGGEYTTSIIFLVEQSAPSQRGFVEGGLLLCNRRISLGLSRSDEMRLLDWRRCLPGLATSVFSGIAFRLWPT